jgi:ADP-heptose:LPS heptosyltransferase
LKYHLVLKDSKSYTVGDLSFTQNQEIEIEDELMYLRLLWAGQFEETPPQCTYWVRNPGSSRHTTRVDGKFHSFPVDEPVRVPRRLFTKLPVGGTVERVYPKEILDTLESPSILVIRNMGIGDILISTELVRNLKFLYPTSKISYATFKRHMSLLENNPDIERIYQIGEVDPFSFNTDINLCHKSEKYPDCTWMIRSDMYSREAGIPIKSRGIHLHLTQEERDWAWEYLRIHRKGPESRIVAIQPKGSGEHRSLKEETVYGLIERLKREGIQTLIYGNDETHYPHEHESALNLCGSNLTLRQVCALISQMDLVICPDSSGYHIAAALDPPIPSLVLFTTIAPDVRTFYYPKCWSMITEENLSCRPCWDRTCVPLPCRNFDSEIVFQKAMEILNGTAVPQEHNIRSPIARGSGRVAVMENV